MSTTEAELVALATATQEAIWLKGLAEEVFLLHKQPVIMYCDNRSAISMAERPEQRFSERTKHITMQRDFFLNYIENKFIEIKWVPTETQLADIMTKPLSGIMTKHFTTMLGLKA
jgi:hypothetical protein